MKIDRLLGITIYLLNHKKTSASKLADRFEVSVRTIVRDIDTLCLAGIPVTSSYGTDGGYEIMNTFSMKNQIADTTDYLYIVTALEGLASAYHDRNIDDILEKMHRVCPNNNSGIVLDFGSLNENASINELLYILNNAIQIKHNVEFSYTNATNIKKKIVVEPVAVMYKWYAWYLLAYSAKYEDYRVYKLVRIESLKIMKDINSIKHNQEDAVSKWESAKDNREYVDIKMICKADIKAKCKEYLNGKILEEYENGNFLYEINVPEDEQFWYGTILSFGNKARIIEPQSVIEKIKHVCSETLHQYNLKH